LVLTDTAVLIQRRFLLTDELLHFFFVCRIVVCKFALRLQTHSATWRCSLVLVVLLFAFAISTKFTAGGKVVVAAMPFAFDIMRTRSVVDWCSLVMLLLVAVYATGIYLLQSVAYTTSGCCPGR
jgi:dolichyl-phosphate-mannose--protein O-mannosyl transferase